MTDSAPPAIDVTQVEAQRRIADRAGRLSAPLYDENQLDEPDENVQINLDRACARAENTWKITEEDDLRTAVFSRFCELLPLVNLALVSHDPTNADFHWSRVRCFISAAGYAAHHKLATICCNLYPQCALRPDETQTQWEEALREAHRVSGWPVTLACVTWRELMAVYGPLERSEIGERDGRWWHAVALLHVLKHARDDGTRIVVTYNGTPGFLRYEDGTNVIGQMRKFKGQLLGLLAGGNAGASEVNPLAYALSNVLNHTTVRSLLRRQPLTDLPGLVLHGPWSSVVPDPTRVDGFVQHGLKLSGVWLANQGRVNETSGGDEDVVRFQWHLEADSDAVHQARTRFEKAIPRMFTVEFPTNLLRWAFPNLVTSMFTDVDAGLSLYDAIICLSVIRSEMPGAESEYPMVLVMPSDPTPEDSTNQGKSKCAHLLAQAVAPGVPITQAADNESAPDQRALAALIAEHGTLCLDEWRQAKSKNALLSHDSLQSLVTGGSRSIGRVYENTSASVRLRQPVIASTKCASLPPDMINRSVCMWLSTLSDEARDRLDVVTEMDTGRLPLRMRLAAIALCQEYRLASTPARACPSFRFPVTFGLAVELYRLRTNKPAEECAAALAKASTEIHAHLAWHTHIADDSGLLAVQEDAQSVRVRLSSMFDNLTVAETAALAQLCDMRGEGGRVTIGAFVKARGEQVNMPGRSLSAILSFVTGSRMQVSDRAIALALGRDIRRLMPNEGDTWLLPDTPGLAGWRLERVSDVNRSPRIRLVTRNEETPGH